MNKREIMDIMASDMKLWDNAKTEDHGGGKVTKTLDLPFGIGEYSVTLEGLKDATKRREACGSYGAHIRGLIKERIDDEAITARAKAAAARNEQANSGDSLLVGPQGVPVKSAQEETLPGSGETHEVDAEDDGDIGAKVAARASKIRKHIKDSERNIKGWRRELKGLEAWEAAMQEEDDEDEGKV